MAVIIDRFCSNHVHIRSKNGGVEPAGCGVVPGAGNWLPGRARAARRAVLPCTSCQTSSLCGSLISCVTSNSLYVFALIRAPAVALLEFPQSHLWSVLEASGMFVRILHQSFRVWINVMLWSVSAYFSAVIFNVVSVTEPSILLKVFVLLYSDLCYFFKTIVHYFIF